MSLPAQVWETITWREGSADWLVSRDIRLRGRAAQRDQKLPEPRAEKWLLIEWPEGEAEPTKDRLSTLPADIAFAGLIDLANLRWREVWIAEIGLVDPASKLCRRGPDLPLLE